MEKVIHFSSVHIWSDTRILKKECSSLAQAGYEVHWVCARGENASDPNVQIHLLPPVTSKWKRMWLGSFRVYRKAMSLNATIYHFHDPELLPWGLLMQMQGKKVIYDVHESVPGDILSKEYIPKWLRSMVASIVGSLELFVGKRLSAVICATSFISLRFIKVNPLTVVVNNYPKKNELQLGVGEGRTPENRLLYVGDITYARGMIQMMDALAMLPELKLDLAGKFSDAGLESVVRSHRAWKQVEYHGFIDRKKYAELLAVCKIGLVLFLPEPNHINAQPNKLFEYMSAGLAVLASHFPLWKEIVEDQDTGRCVDPTNAQEIANQIRLMLSDEKKLQSMGEKGKQSVAETFNWEREELTLLDLYKKIS